MNFSETICAIATAPGGAIGTIRVSGPDAIRITDLIFKGVGGKTLSASKPYTLSFGQIIGEKEEVVDEVLVSVFHAPHSYTGENSVSEATHRLAMSQMRGGFSRELSQLRDQLLHLTSLMELELDFSDHEELEFADRSELRTLAEKIEQVIRHLAQSFRLGNAIKNGFPVAIVGETNAGKSTLLNALLHEERAIVSDIHGTTRDVIEDTINLGGITFRFIDTAGIRETTDTIESLGIERSFQKMEQAQIVLWVVDSQCAAGQIRNLSSKILPLCANKKLIVVLNKAELLAGAPPSHLPELPENVDVISISARLKLGLEQLQNQLIAAAQLPEVGEHDVVVTNLRHYEALTQALDSIERVLQGIDQGLSGDFISQDLRECLFHLAEIVGGEITTDEVLGNIFKNFCIGK